MKNNFITKIIGATLAFAMMIGVGAGVNAFKIAKEVNADETYTNREAAFTASPLPSGLGISSTGGLGSSQYIMSSNDYATIDSSWLFNDGEVLSSDNMSISVSIGTYGTWSGAKTVKYRVAFLDSEGAELSYSVGNSASGMTKGPAYSNGPAVNLAKPSNPADIAKLKITFTDFTTTASGSLRFAGVKMTYDTETLDVSAVTSIALTAENDKRTLDLNETVQLTAVVKDASDNPIENANVTFSSSDSTVASVDDDGLVTASSTNYGSATITASYAGDANYNASQATILIRIVNPNESDFVIADIASENNWVSGTAYSSLGTIGNVTITGAGSGNNKKYYSSDSSWRFYSGGSITISTSAGYLKKITLHTSEAHHFTSAPANWSYSNDVFTSSNKLQTSVVLSNGSNTSKITQIDVQIGFAFTVSYNANGGTGTMTDSNSPYDKNTTVTVLENAFNAPSGMMFDHWNTSANDSGASYDAGDTFAISANTTLYAQWVSAGNNPYIAGLVDSISGVYSGQTQNVAFTYGNFDNVPSLVSGNEAILTITNIDVDDENDSSATLNFVGAGSTNLFVKDGEDIIKTVPVAVTASTVTITGLASTGAVQVGKTLNLGNTITVTPVGSYSDEVTWESDNDNIATVSEDGVVTGVELGTVDITVSSVEYPSAFMTCAVTVSAVPAENMAKVNSIAIGDVVYLATEATKHQYSSHAGGNTIYATGESYSTKPVDSQPGFEIVAGDTENSFAFKVTSGTNADKYLTWLAGNSLEVAATIDENSSWTVSFDENDNATIKNVKDNTRVIWWNDASPRFACYTGKTDDNTYDSVQLWKLTTPNDYMESATTIRTINGTANYVDETVVSVDSVALRFGASISKDNWDAINAQWKITDYGVMLLKETTLTSYSKASVEAAFRGGETVTNLHRGSGAVPTTLGDDYFFTVKINIADDTDYETVYCAAPYIKAGGSYYFFTEMRDSVRTMAGTNPSSSLSAAALAFLAGN